MAYPYYPQQTYPQSYQPLASYYPQQQPAAQSSMIWVSGLAEAQAFPVAPNNAVALWEQSGKTLYLKSADATGKPGMRIYDLTERTETAQKASDVKSVDYATKNELSAITDTIKSISGDIEQMKSDLYGVAGRKKAVKKAEDSDDE